MTREEYLKELNKAFGNFKFFADDHHYECKGKRVGISVTRFYALYEPEVDFRTKAEKKAPKVGKTVDELLNEWKYKADLSCDKGTSTHEYVQSLFSGAEYKELYFDGSQKYFEALRKCKVQAYNFYRDYKDLYEHLADEYTIGSEEYDIASNIDHLFINKNTGGLVLVDYKTNSDIYKKERYNNYMKVPLSHLKDTDLNHYALQLSIYRYIVEKYTDLKFEDMFIVWFTEENENYKILEIPYLKEEVEKILEMRRIKNMKSISVLVIGKSGSGKSSSLRNLKPEEYSLVNPLSKELPFKSSVKGLESDNYEKIKYFITETPKKIVVIDDSNYLITNQFMKNHSKGGTGNAVFAVYNDLADKYWDLIQHQKNTEGGKIIFNFMHEEETENGNIIPKTVGKLLNEKVCIEGMYTIVIRAMYKDGKHIFRLKTDGNDCVKAPIGMFEEEECDNDLKYIIDKIREYYELDDKEEIKEDNKKEEEK